MKKALWGSYQCHPDYDRERERLLRERPAVLQDKHGAFKKMLQAARAYLTMWKK